MFLSINKIPFINYNSNCQKNNLLPKVSYPNLAPLPKDTISFTGRGMLKNEDMIDAPAQRTCQHVEDYAEPAKFFLETVLDKYLGPYLSKDESSKANKYPIFKYSVRVKSSPSIREKVASKYSNNINDDRAKVIDIISKTIVDEFFEEKQNKDELKELVNEKIEQVTPFDKHSGLVPSPTVYTELLLNNLIEYLRYTPDVDKSKFSNSNIENIKQKIISQVNDKTSTNDIDNGVYINPKTKFGIKHYANDILGARVTIRSDAQEYTNLIIYAIKQAITNGDLKIESIENYVPDVNRIPKDRNVEDYEYISVHKLTSLANLANAPLITKTSKSGYIGVHVNLDLSNDLYDAVDPDFNGYSGEIQIIGHDVLRLKDVEDLCYKLKDNKHAINSAYKPFKDYFQKYYVGDTKKAFDDYTYSLYLAMRDIPSDYRRNRKFPTIKELGYEGKVPPQLDFNILSELKKSCDIKRKIDENNRKQKPLTNREKDKLIEYKCNVKTCKNLLKNSIKEN